MRGLSPAMLRSPTLICSCQLHHVAPLIRYPLQTFCFCTQTSAYTEPELLATLLHD